MKVYFIYIDSVRFTVSGCEAAFWAFRKACDFAEILGLTVYLVDGETGEVLDYNQDDE